MNLKRHILCAAALLAGFGVQACMWDRDTLSDERQKSPKMAEVIFGGPPKPADPAPLLLRIKELTTNRRNDDPAWWNDMAGAYLRLGKAKEAAELLEPVIARFPKDYGIHANLGTAYHLLGRYQQAEGEIARDLEINPDGHFGLEKYHLALLQYLIRDDAYRAGHVYVDEWSEPMLKGEWNDGQLLPFESVLREESLAVETLTNGFPQYRQQWNLATDTNFEAGVIYMAAFNPREPACCVMLGVACLAKPGYGRDLNLAKVAFQKAIQLGSAQSETLKRRMAAIDGHIQHAHPFAFLDGVVILLLVILSCLILYHIYKKTEARRRNS